MILNSDVKGNERREFRGSRIREKVSRELANGANLVEEPGLVRLLTFIEIYINCLP